MSEKEISEKMQDIMSRMKKKTRRIRYVIPNTF